jgi:hypothetical protein
LAHRANNHSVIIEFRVDDVDSEYQKLRALSVDFVNEPPPSPGAIAPFYFATPTAT